MTLFPEKFRYLKTHLFGFEIVLTQEQKSIYTDEKHSTLDTFSAELVFFKTLAIGRGTFWENKDKSREQNAYHLKFQELRTERLGGLVFTLFEGKTKTNTQNTIRR